MIAGLKNNDIDIITSNHTPCLHSEKTEPMDRAAQGNVTIEFVLGNIIFTTTNGSYWVGKFNIVICKKDNEGDLINLLRDYHHDNGQDFKGGNQNKTEKIPGEYLAFEVEGKEW